MAQPPPDAEAAGPLGTHATGPAASPAEPPADGADPVPLPALISLVVAAGTLLDVHRLRGLAAHGGFRDRGDAREPHPKALLRVVAVLGR